MSLRNSPMVIALRVRSDGSISLSPASMGRRGGQHVEAADDEFLVAHGGGVTPVGYVVAPAGAGTGSADVPAWYGCAVARGGTRSARQIESRAVLRAARTFTQRRLTVQKPV